MTPEPFDASSLLDEIRDGARPFTLDDETFMLLPPAAWPDAVIEAANRGDALTASKLMLGPDEYKRFTKAGGSAGLLERIVAKLFGAPMGESSASSPS